MEVPLDGHGGGETIHEAVFWQVRVQIGTDFGEVRGQTAEEQNVCPRHQPAIVEEIFDSYLDELHWNGTQAFYLSFVTIKHSSLG